MAKCSRKLLYINITLIVITLLVAITSILNTLSLQPNAFSRILIKLVVVFFTIKFLIKNNKWGYILCLINGYLLLLLKLMLIPSISLLLESTLLSVLVLIDTLIILAYVVLAHIGLVLSKKLR